MLDQLQLSDFEPFVNQDFLIKFRLPDTELAATLVSAEQLTTRGPGGREPFSLIFQTNQKNQYYLQAIYTLVHPEKGEMELFFVPLGYVPEGMQYQVIFT